MWAGLNRYLASEAAHARRTEEIEDEDEGKGKTDAEAKQVPRQASPPRAQDRE
jgi:hypothetical protein